MEMNDVAKDIIEEVRKNWPAKFFVCEDHKKKYFKDYEQAIVHSKEFCELCHPKDNDSLGG